MRVQIEHEESGTRELWTRTRALAIAIAVSVEMTPGTWNVTRPTIAILQYCQLRAETTGQRDNAQTRAVMMMSSLHTTALATR